MSEEKSKGKRSKQTKAPANPRQQGIPIDQVLQSQFAKVGRLEFDLDTMRQMMIALENENKQLKKQLEKKKK